jgi:hypothetical protein
MRSSAERKPEYNGHYPIDAALRDEGFVTFDTLPLSMNMDILHILPSIDFGAALPAYCYLQYTNGTYSVKHGAMENIQGQIIPSYYARETIHIVSYRSSATIVNHRDPHLCIFLTVDPERGKMILWAHETLLASINLG